MKSPMSKAEIDLRSRFDFSKAVRGKFYEQYKKGHRVTLLEGEPDGDDPLESGERDSQLLEIAGKHLLIARLIADGFEVAEPLRDKGIDLIVYKGGDNFAAFPIQLKASSGQSFSLDEKYRRIPRLQIAYVWNVQSKGPNDVFILTFDEALEVLRAKRYDQTDSWRKNGRYFVKDAGVELKRMLDRYKMTPKLWQSKLQAA
jgi:hypothetical protein